MLNPLSARATAPENVKPDLTDAFGWRLMLRVVGVVAAWLGVLLWPRMHAPYGLAFWLWAAGVAAYVLSFRTARRRWSPPGPLVYLALAAIMIFAAWLRLTALADVPANISIDEILPSTEALHIAQGAPINVFSSTGWFTIPNFTFALPAVVMKLAGHDAFWAARLSSVLTGLAGIFALFLLARRLFGERPALLASFLMAAAFWHLHNSRTAFPFVQSSSWTALVIYLLTRARQDDSPAAFALTGMTLGLALQCYFPVRILIILCPLFFLAGAWQERTPWRSLIAEGAAVAVGAVLVLGPLLTSVPWADLAGHSRAVLITQPDTLAQLSATYHISGFAAVFRRNLQEAAGMFSSWADVCVLNRSPAGLLDGATLAALTIGSLAAVLQADGAALLLVAWAGLTFVFGVALSDAPRASYRMAAAMPALFMLAAYGVDRVFVLPAPRWRWYRVTVRTLLILLLGWWVATENYRMFFVAYAKGDGREMSDGAVRRLLASHCDGRRFYFVGDWLAMGLRGAEEPKALDLFCLQHQPLSIDKVPTQVDVTRPAMFLILPSEVRLTAALRQCYPSARVTEQHASDGRLLFESIEVTPAELAAGRTCVVTPAAAQ